MRPLNRLRPRLALALALVLAAGLLGGTTAPARADTIVQNVLVIIYDPPGANPYNPVTLTNELASWIEEASIYHGYKQSGSSQVDIRIYGSPVIHYEQAPQESPPTYSSQPADYHAIFDDHGICDLVNRERIDEVWLWSDSSGGFFEARQAGKPGTTISTNGPPLDRNDCLLPVDVLGFNFEVATDNALHSYGHLTENVISHLLDGKDRYSVQSGDDWYEFDGQVGYDGTLDLNRYCGNVHWTPNAQTLADDYDYNLSYWVRSDCENWNPQHTGSQGWIRCNDWGCDQEGYLKWWFQNMPGENNGMTRLDGAAMPGWWQLIFKFDDSICREHDGDVGGCNGEAGCGYYYCSGQCHPTGTSNCDAGCLSYCGNSACRYYDGWVSGCDAQPGCAYYYCSNQCHPTGTTNCSAGCQSYCSPMCRVHDGWVSGCDAISECAYYYCSGQCHPTGTSNCAAGCC